MIFLVIFIQPSHFDAQTVTTPPSQCTQMAKPVPFLPPR